MYFYVLFPVIAILTQCIRLASLKFVLLAIRSESTSGNSTSRRNRRSGINSAIMLEMISFFTFYDRQLNVYFQQTDCCTSLISAANKIFHSVYLPMRTH